MSSGASLVTVTREHTQPATIEALLLELIAEVRGLREDLRQQRRPSSLSRADRAVLARLLPAISRGAFGSELFLTADVFASDNAALRVARRGLNARQLGRLLRRAVGTPIDGLVVERVASEAGAVVWRISEFLGNQNLFVPHASSREL